jgi:hypothetical protein
MAGWPGMAGVVHNLPLDHVTAQAGQVGWPWPGLYIHSTGS